MIDLNGLTKQLGDYRRKNCLPQGNYEYSFLRAIGETIEAYEAHKRGDDINLGEELADAIIFILDVADQKTLTSSKHSSRSSRKSRGDTMSNATVTS